LLVHGGDYKLCIVDEARVVRIDGLEHLLNLVIRDNLAVVVKIALFNLVHGEASVSIFVESLEYFGKFFLLLLREHLTCDICIRSLFKCLVSSEVLEIVQRADSDRLIDGYLSELGDPGVLECVSGGGALLLVVCEQLRDEVLGNF